MDICNGAVCFGLRTRASILAPKKPNFRSSSQATRPRGEGSHVVLTRQGF